MSLVKTWFTNLTAAVPLSLISAIAPTPGGDDTAQIISSVLCCDISLKSVANIHESFVKKVDERLFCIF
jgi:hypothetical protein